MVFCLARTDSSKLFFCYYLIVGCGVTVVLVSRNWYSLTCTHIFHRVISDFQAFYDVISRFCLPNFLWATPF